MKEKTWQKVTVVVAWGIVLLVVLSLLGAMYIFIGNPASWFIAKNSAANYVEENYPNENYELVRFGFDFIGPYYYADFEHMDKPDNHFTVHVNYWGKVNFSTYDNIEDGWNTAYRLTEEYNDIFVDLYFGRDFPFENFRGHCDLGMIYDEVEIEGMQKRQELVPNKQYDVSKIAEKQGMIFVEMSDSSVTEKRLGEILIQLKEFLFEKGCPFYMISITLSSDDEKNEDMISLENFPASLIGSENMAEEIEKYLRQ